jgi:hypothetical protein
LTKIWEKWTALLIDGIGQFRVTLAAILVCPSSNSLCNESSRIIHTGVAIIFFIGNEGGTVSNICQVACYLSIRFLYLFSLFKRGRCYCILRKQLISSSKFLYTDHSSVTHLTLPYIFTYIRITFWNKFRLSPSSLLLILQLCINFVGWLKLQLFVLNGTRMWAMSPAS